MSNEKKPEKGDADADIIAGLKRAEEHSAKSIEEARAKKEERVRDAQDKAHSMDAKAVQDAEALKAKLLAQARAEISKDEGEVLAKARKAAEGLKRNKVNKKFVQSTVKKLLEELDA